jgi:glycosyltransferase involved in cell wall biosynthesis
VNPIGVLHVIDTLEVGGAERMAVNLVNCLPRERYRPYLCTTRRSGSLVTKVRSDVTLINLARRNRFDLAPLKRIADFVRKHDIRLLHAHGPALFFSKVTTICVPGTTLIWHAHYGGLPSQNWRAVLYRLACTGATVITVNEELAIWARERLCVPAARVHYLQNFVEKPDSERRASDLPGESGFRVACLANIRAEKDHLTLLRAFATVVRRFPRAHLLLIGAPSNQNYYGLVLKCVADLGLSGQVSFLGPVEDVYDVLKACDVGVMSSATEGLPMALLEYGVAGLPTVATRVGQCPPVLNDGKAGILVDARSPKALAGALEDLLESPERRQVLGEAFRDHIGRNYATSTAVGQLCRIYDDLCSHTDLPTQHSSLLFATGLLDLQPTGQKLQQSMDRAADKRQKRRQSGKGDSKTRLPGSW